MKNEVINLRKVYTYGQKISGHFTQGHVDTVTIVKNVSIMIKLGKLNSKFLKKNIPSF